jgi:LuxR family maltose regulon positive regulatory protein
MADLLKQLIEQNVAVDYIGRILDAFKEDEHSATQDESDQLITPSSHNRFSSSSSKSAFRIPNSDLHTSQPLVEPLTNRELDVLALLAQRFQNKEIAEKLFISPETVKKHLNNIYGKLNVSNRRQAVEKAETLGILKR